MTKKERATVYWLIPEKAAREFFAKIINELAAEFDAPIFEPHVTIFLGPENSRAAVEVLREFGPVDFELAVRGIQFGEKFTKTVFVQFEKSDTLQKLGDAIWKLNGAGCHYVIDPHLSLVYARLAPKIKRTLAKTVLLPFAKVRFDEIHVMRCASPTENAREVRAWTRSG